MVSLTRPQMALLRLTVADGCCTHFAPAHHHSAWVVRASGGVRTFAQGTGDALLSLGFLAPDPDPIFAVVYAGHFTIRRYVVTPAGLKQAAAHVARRR